MPQQVVDFQVWGKVQNVFMRKYTKKKADELSITGWVQNTADKTIKGQMCSGSPEALAEFKRWLETEGSPKARPTRAEFSVSKVVETSPFDGFGVRRVKLANGTEWA
jgi:acylphosphatase